MLAHMVTHPPGRAAVGSPRSGPRRAAGGDFFCSGTLTPLTFFHTVIRSDHMP